MPWWKMPPAAAGLAGHSRQIGAAGSAKDGTGVSELFEAIVPLFPPPNRPAHPNPSNA